MKPRYFDNLFDFPDLLTQLIILCIKLTPYPFADLQLFLKHLLLFTPVPLDLLHFLVVLKWQALNPSLCLFSLRL